MYNLHSENQVALPAQDAATLSVQDEEARNLFNSLELFCVISWTCYPVTP